MNLALPSGPLAQAIGWALLHLVWQGALVAALLAAVLSRLSGRSANVRYAISCAALAVIVALGVATAMKSYAGATPPAAARPGRSIAPSVAPEPQLPALMLTALLRTPPEGLRAYVRTANDTLPGLVTVWLLGVAFLSLRLILEWLRARRLVNRSTSPARDAWQAAARRLGEALGVRHAVRVLESAAIEVPSVIGLLRPAILLPVSTLSGLTPAQLEMILSHELAHIRRHDFLVNLLQTAVETLLFYHPAVWWISRQVRIERENCCDDLAVALCGNPVHYARALARLEELRTTRVPLAVSAAGGSLFQRVRRLVDGSTGSTGPAVRGASAIAVISCLLLVIATQSFSAIGVRRSAWARPHPHVTAGVTTPSAREEKPGQAAAPERVRPASDTRQDVADPTSNADPAADPASDSNAELGSVAVAASEPDAWTDPDEGRPSLDELIALRAQNVSAETIREMRALFPNVRLMEIASMSAVGVTPDYVREMRQLGLDVRSPGDAQGLAAVGVTREYVRAMRGAGFPLRSAGEAQGLRAVGVTPEYVREMRDAGFPLKSAGEAQGLMAVGVTPDYVRAMRDAGVAIDRAGDVQSLRALGITPEFVRRLADAGYPNLSVSQLSRLAAAGVTGDFIREMSKYRTR